MTYLYLLHFVRHNSHFNTDASFSYISVLKLIIIYLQSECIEKYQFKLCSKYGREYGFDVILG